MAKIEVDETELQTYQQVYNAVRAGLQNPKTRDRLLAINQEITGTAHPEVSMRGQLDEFKAEIVGELGKFREEFSKKENDREETAQRKELEIRWSSSQADAQRQGYLGDGLQKLETFMEKHGIADHRIAIPAFEKENPPPRPLETGSQRFDFFGAKETRPPDLQALLEGNDDVFLATAIPAALAEVRGS